MTARRARGHVEDRRSEELAAIGAHLGEVVRWQDRAGGRWQEGTVTHREGDGSLGVVDGDGRARSLASERLQVRSSGSRGAKRWEPFSIRAARGDQLCLFA